jgi:hypothetical protein
MRVTRDERRLSTHHTREHGPNDRPLPLLLAVTGSTKRECSRQHKNLAFGNHCQHCNMQFLIQFSSSHLTPVREVRPHLPNRLARFLSQAFAGHQLRSSTDLTHGGRPSRTHATHTRRHTRARAAPHSPSTLLTSDHFRTRPCKQKRKMLGTSACHALITSDATSSPALLQHLHTPPPALRSTL